MNKKFKIISENERDNYLSMIEGMQEVIEDDQDFRTEYVKYQSLCVIQYFLENINQYPHTLDVDENLYEWLEELKIQVEECEYDNLNDMRIEDIYDRINWEKVPYSLYERFVKGGYESDDKEELIKIFVNQNRKEN
tara:strand:+ start:232 stop:639 length:408 start_codon:yes stop_codon:yes gene_type:complete